MANNQVKEEEREFVVLYNAGNGEMHEVILTYDETILVGLFLQDLMKKKGKKLEADSAVACKINITKDKVLVKEDCDETSSSNI